MRNILFCLGIAPLFFWSASPMNSNRIVDPDHNQKIIQPEISIADSRIVEGNAGQRSVEVLISISQVPLSPVTMVYNTKNGTATAGSDYGAMNGTITFSKGDMLKKILVPVNGDLAAEASETFEIILSNPSGASLLDSISTVTIVNDDMSGPGLSVYEVRFTFTGYMSFSGTAADCKIRSNGKVVLTGLLSGSEKVPADDDIRYTGTLQMDMDIDICSISAIELPGGGYPHCGITTMGSGPVETELEIYFDGRGGYIKIENRSGRFMKNTLGSCDQGQIDEERGMIPNKTIASIFNGYELPMLTQRTLRVGRYVNQAEGGEVVVEVLRVIRP